MKNSKFGTAFKEARAAGNKVFTFGGKKYTTELAKPKVKSKDERDPALGRDATPKESEEMLKSFGYPDVPKPYGSENTTELSDMAYKKGGQVKHSDMSKGKPMMKKIAGEAVKSHEKKMHKMSSGGSASSRADGCAQRGKTRA